MYPNSSWNERDQGQGRGGRQQQQQRAPNSRPLPSLPPDFGGNSPYQQQPSAYQQPYQQPYQQQYQHQNSPYQQMRPRNSYETRDHAGSRQDLVNPMFSVAPQNSPGMRRGHRPQRHSPLPYNPSPEPYLNQNSSQARLTQLPTNPSEQHGDMAKMFAPFRSFAYQDQQDQGIQHQRSLDGSKDSSSDSQTSSRRASFVADGGYMEPSRDDPGWGQEYAHGGQGSGPESIPGTPLAPPTPTWMYNSSPVASSLHLPFSGYTNSPGAASMSSLSSAPFRSQRELLHMFPDASEDVFEREWVKQGYIAKIHRRDDKDEWPNWKRYLFYTVPFLALATLGTYWLYFGGRIYCIISAQAAQNRHFPLAWLFVGIEISVAIPTFLQMFWMVFILKGRSRPKLRLVGNDVPTVDVFITCCGEDIDVVLDTARGACDVDYPQDRFRVVILDDANDEQLRDGIVALNETYPNVAYRSRPKFPGVPHHFKAGNLNYGLEVVHEMPGGASKFMAALDADMIPEQHWLRAIMPHMLEDEKLALACPPQLFYNVPPGDPLCQSLDFFVNVSEPIKDALGVAWCTGSGYVVRRDALEEIGCFPQGSLAEDVATSTLLLGRGWKTAFIHEPLQFGTVPEDYGSHLKQRTRWAIGTVETSIRLKFCLYGKEIEKLTGYQRMSSIIYAILSLYNIFLTISLFALPVVLLSGNALVAYANVNQLRWLIRACFLALCVNRVCELAMFLPSGYFTGQRGARSQIWMAPYITVSIIRSFVLPSWLGGQKQAFKPTGSLKSELNERDPARRAGVWQRFRVITTNYMAGYHLFYVYLVLTAVTLTTLRCIFENPNAQDKLLCLVTHAFWPPIAWIITLSAFWVPINYALNPPSVPHREQLLQRNLKTGVAHPTKKSKKIAFKAQTAMFEFEYLISTAYTAAIFIATFIIKTA